LLKCLNEDLAEGRLCSATQLDEPPWPQPPMVGSSPGRGEARPYFVIVWCWLN